MQFSSASIVAAVLALTPLTQAFSVTNCGTGAYKNFGSGGNSQCHDFATSKSVSYDSDKGRRIYVYKEPGCKGQVFVTNKQDVCVDVGFDGQSVTTK